MYYGYYLCFWAVTQKEVNREEVVSRRRQYKELVEVQALNDNNNNNSNNVITMSA